MCWNLCFTVTETLKERVQFGFCKERGQWFWSPDSFIWIHVSRLLVPSGLEKNKVPNADDIATIQFLAKQQIRVQYPVSPCPVCKFMKCNSCFIIIKCIGSVICAACTWHFTRNSCYYALYFRYNGEVHGWEREHLWAATVQRVASSRCSCHCNVQGLQSHSASIKKRNGKYIA